MCVDAEFVINETMAVGDNLKMFQGDRLCVCWGEIYDFNVTLLPANMMWWSRNIVILLENIIN